MGIKEVCHGGVWGLETQMPLEAWILDFDERGTIPDIRIALPGCNDLFGGVAFTMGAPVYFTNEICGKGIEGTYTVVPNDLLDSKAVGGGA